MLLLAVSFISKHCTSSWFEVWSKFYNLILKRMVSSACHNLGECILTTCNKTVHCKSKKKHTWICIKVFLTFCEFMQCSVNSLLFPPSLDEQGNQRTLTQESLMMNDPEQVKVAVQALQVPLLCCEID